MFLSEFLSSIRVNLNQLLLDPNNPRFSELGEELNLIPEQRFNEEKIQKITKEKMKNPTFDVSELKDTIKTVGFLPMDRIVVRKWKGVQADAIQKYVVIEGNRRVTALKWLIDLHELGKETFTDKQLNNFNDIDALIIDDSIAPDTATLILPGLRHVSGVKEWGPYQKAKAIHSLRRSGMSPQEAAQSLGLATRTANNSYRVYLALEQMNADDEYGEYTTPRMYSYFEETFKRSEVKNWLNWDDQKEIFTNEQNLEEFYSWMIPNQEIPDEKPKLPEAKSIRDLGLIINDEQALNVFRSPEGNLARALAKYEVDHPADWYPKILASLSAIRNLTPETLRKMEQPSIESLEQLSSSITQALNDRKALLGI